MKAVFITLALILLLSFSQPIAAMSGNELMKSFNFCDAYRNGDKTLDNYYSCGAATNYIKGTLDAWDMNIEWQKKDEEYCIPSEVTFDQINRIVKKRMEAHPETLHLTAGYLVVKAMNEAFPCE